MANTEHPTHHDHETRHRDESPEEIRREADETRHRIDDTLDAIEHKFNPRAMVDEAMRYWSGSPAEFTSNLGASVKHNPMPLLLIGTGIAWMMMSERRETHRYHHEPRGPQASHLHEPDPYRPGYGQGMPGYGYGPDYTEPGHREHEDASLKDKAGNVAEAAKHRAQGAAHAASAKAHEAAHSAEAKAQGAAHSASAGAQGAAHSASAKAQGAADEARYRYEEAKHRAAYAARGARERASEWGDEASYQARHMAERARYGAERARHEAYYRARRAEAGFEHMLNEQPLVLGALGVAVGALLGSLLPATRREDETIGPYRDELRHEAEAYGREQYHKAERVAQSARDAATEEAHRQNLDKQGAQAELEKGKEKAESVAEAAKEAGEAEAQRQNLGGSGGTTGSASAPAPHSGIGSGSGLGSTTSSSTSTSEPTSTQREEGPSRQ